MPALSVKNMEATVVDLFYNQDRQLQSKGMPVTDEQMLLEYRQTGDRELFAQLVYRYERELFLYLRRYLGNREWAQDAFQATFLDVHLKCEFFDATRRFRPWLYTIATNRAIDTRRRNARHQMVSLDSPAGNFDDEVSRIVNLLESSDASPEEKLQSAERVALVRTALESLPEASYTVIQLVYFQGMKYGEVAEVLDLPLGTVKSRLNAAIHRLAEAWSQTEVD